MNGFEAHTAYALTGIMDLGACIDEAWTLVEGSDYLVGIDTAMVNSYLEDIKNGKTLNLDRQHFEEDLFTL
jgi:hypothetical protein